MNEIEKMAAIIEADYKEWLDITGCLPDCSSYYYECLGGAKDSAKKLHNAGYGNVKEAVREFAERLKKRLAQKEVNLYNGKSQVIQIDMQTSIIIDKLVKEVCGE